MSILYFLLSLFCPKPYFSCMFAVTKGTIMSPANIYIISDEIIRRHARLSDTPKLALGTPAATSHQTDTVHKYFISKIYIIYIYIYIITDKTE
jgi:hypothetical protein